MSLPDVPTAAEMAEFLRRNDARTYRLDFHDGMYEAMENWTAGERRGVTAAARDDKSISRVCIDVAGMTDKASSIIASIVGRLANVLLVEIYDSSAREDDDPPAPRATVDKALAAVAKCPSSVRALKLCVPSSPRAFLNLVEKVPDLEEFTYEDRYQGTVENPDDDDDDDPAADRIPFLMAVATAASRHLRSLRHVGLEFEISHPGIPCLLSALHAMGSNLQTVELAFQNGEFWGDVLLQVASFCTCTLTARTVICRGEDALVDGMVDMSPLFGVDPAPGPFSPTLTEVRFQFATFHARGRIAARVGKALQNVESLRFDMCSCPFALSMLDKLPRLRSLAYRSHPAAGGLDHLDPDEAQDAYDERFAFLQTNQDITAFCRIVNRKASLLEDVELDVQGSEGEAFPALARLLQVSRGRLVLHLWCLPRAACSSIVRGMGRLNPRLRELHLRFHYCRLIDRDYEDIFRPLQSNNTLRYLECQWEQGDGSLGDRTRAALHDLVEANGSIGTLAFRGLDPEAAAAALESIVPALRSTNRSIHTLNLNWIDLADVWPRLRGPMLDALRENYVLSHLMNFAEPNLLGFDPHHDPVEFLVKQNRYGRRLLMGRSGGGGGGDDDNDSNNSHDGRSGSGPSTSFFCPLGLWATVLARISDDDEEQVMYKFLRSKPDLLLAGLAPARRPVRGRPNRGRKRGRGLS